MRILYHHRTLADGAEGIHIAEMVAAFRDLGHEVRVLGIAADDDAAARRGWIARVRSLLPAVLFEAGSVATNAVEYWQTRRAIRAFRPHLLYKRHARNDVGAVSAARHAGVPSVLEVNCLFTGPGYHQFEPLALERVAAALERYALRAATVRIAVSTPLAGQIAQVAGVEAVVVPNGANAQRFDPALAAPATVREQYGLGSSLVIGWTGVIREWHGLELLLDAVAQLPGAHLLIVGDGPAREALQARARSQGMGERFTITGRIPHGDVPNHIAAMDIAVVASDKTGVASPMKLLEYMSMARAVVAPKLPNVEDVVPDAGLGRLFRPDDVSDLVRALRGLADDPAARRQLGDAARRAVLEHRNWHSIAKIVLAALPCTDQGPAATAD
jgi:glycosyltransferase involved in cell wall biosynthesis